jgi:hypothetical protein
MDNKICLLSSLRSVLSKFFGTSTIFSPFNIQLDLLKTFSSKLCGKVFDRRKLIENDRIRAWRNFERFGN